jgi:hypothetical protein
MPLLTDASNLAWAVRQVGFFRSVLCVSSLLTRRAAPTVVLLHSANQHLHRGSVCCAALERLCTRRLTADSAGRRTASPRHAGLRACAHQSAGLLSRRCVRPSSRALSHRSPDAGFNVVARYDATLNELMLEKARPAALQQAPCGDGPVVCYTFFCCGSPMERKRPTVYRTRLRCGGRRTAERSRCFWASPPSAAHRTPGAPREALHEVARGPQAVQRTASGHGAAHAAEHGGQGPGAPSRITRLPALTAAWRSSKPSLRWNSSRSPST